MKQRAAVLRARLVLMLASGALATGACSGKTREDPGAGGRSDGTGGTTGGTSTPTGGVSTAGGRESISGGEGGAGSGGAENEGGVVAGGVPGSGGAAAGGVAAGGGGATAGKAGGGASGSGSGADAGQTFVPPPGATNCHNPGPGWCCDYTWCFPPDEVLESFPGQVMVVGAGGAGGASDGGGGEASLGGAASEATQCPVLEGSWLCGNVRSGPQIGDGECCYVVNSGSCCGRPFLVNGRPRMAPVSESTTSTWSLAAFDVPSADPALRRDLAERWLSDARMEHASIAAFARFALQLLALGAPSTLVAGCQRAMADEIRHAEACFSLASAYAGRAVGPGRLDTSGSVTETDLGSIAELVIEEGCFGETIAALIAAEEAARCELPQIRDVLRGIAEDEARHAELAWSFVQWAHSTGTLEVRRRIEAAFARLEPPRPVQPRLTDARSGELDDSVLAAHGRLTLGERAELARAALTDVVRPCAEALMSAGAAQSADGAERSETRAGRA